MPYKYHGRFVEVKPHMVHRFTQHEDAMAKGIAKFYEEKGYSPERAKQIGYATINRIKVGRKTIRI